MLKYWRTADQCTLLSIYLAGLQEEGEGYRFIVSTASPGQWLATDQRQTIRSFLRVHHKIIPLVHPASRLVVGHCYETLVRRPSVSTGKLRA